MFLIHTENNRFGFPVCFLQEVCQMPSNSISTGLKGDDALEVFGLVLTVRYRSTVFVELPLVGSPAGRIKCCQDSMNTIGGQEAVFNSLL